MLSSLVCHLPEVRVPTSTSLSTRCATSHAAKVLLYFTGGQHTDEDVLGELVSVTVQGYQSGAEGTARIVVAAIAMHSDAGTLCP